MDAEDFMRSLILVGQAPNRLGNPGTPLEGQVGHKLCDLFGCSRPQYLKQTQRVNVLRAWPGKAGKGDRFPKALARQRTRTLAKQFDGHRVLFIGLMTSAVFGINHALLRWQAYAWRMRRGWSMFEAAIIPHPSGINRWWNDGKNQRRARRFMRNTWMTILVEDDSGGSL